MECIHRYVEEKPQEPARLHGSWADYACAGPARGGRRGHIR